MGGYFFLSLRGGYIFLMAPLQWWVQTGSHRGAPFKALWSYLFGGPSLKDPDFLEKTFLSLYESKHRAAASSPSILPSL